MTTMTINGRAESLPDDQDALLVDVIRDRLNLTGTKLVCGSGVCGACTVLLDGKPALACLTAAIQLPGREVLTIEGLASRGENACDGELSALQTAFVEETAIQCGYCTSGMIMSASALLARNPDPDEEEIRMALAGNICRCSGYHQIIRAVKRAAKELREGTV